MIHGIIVERGEIAGWRYLRNIGDGEISQVIAHHLIPLEAIDQFEELMRKAAKGGFDINGLSNGMLLRGQLEHVGRHAHYSQEVFRELNRVARKVKQSTPQEDIAKWVQEVADGFRQKINTGQIRVG